MDRRGTLYVVAGPSGVGKGTVVRRVLELVPDVRLSTSVTTRAPRERLGERHAVDYFFVTNEDFDGLVRQGGLLEWAQVFGNRYGTPKAWVEETLARGDDVVLEIDVQGARQVHASMPEAVLVFLRPPSIDELARRLASRGTESEEMLAERLAKAEAEIGAATWFDHVVVNDDVERAAGEVAAIIQTYRSPQGRRPAGTTGPAKEGPFQP